MALFPKSYVTIPQWHKLISYTCFLKGTVFSQLAGLKLYTYKISSMYHGYRSRIICSRKRHSVEMEALQARHGHWKAEQVFICWNCNWIVVMCSLCLFHASKIWYCGFFLVLARSLPKIFKEIHYQRELGLLLTSVYISFLTGNL